MSQLLFCFINLLSTTPPYLYQVGLEQQNQTVEDILNVKLNSKMKLGL
jgi:hypothetical protein